MDYTELRRLAEDIEAECGKVIIGKREQIRLVLTSLFAGGHVLIDDIPGVGKTTLVKALAAVLGCGDRKSTRLNSSHVRKSRMPSSA